MKRLPSIRALVRGKRRGTFLSLAVLAFAALTLVVGAAAADSPPVNNSLPTITGTAQQGHVLTVQSGSWSGANLVFSYQWKRCDAAGANCAHIGGATAQTYTLAGADVGATLRISVTATNSGGASKALSDPTAVVSAVNAPVNTTAPSISGTAQQGATLTALDGSWSGTPPIDFSYTWQICDSHGAGCNTIGGATAQTYVPSSSDVGHTVRVQVKATNSGGSASALSGSSAVIASQGNAPANTAVPTLSGSQLEGSTLTVSQGAWQGAAPLAYAYGWQRCDASGNNCSTISGANGTTYKLAHADVGNRVRGAVTASNTLGATTAYTALSGVVGSTFQAVNTSLPVISGTAAVGKTLSTSNGSWSGATPFQFSYQWARSNSKGGYDPIANATQQRYTVTSADVGHRLYMQVKAQNKYGPAWATSNPTAPVSATAPAAKVIPVASMALPDRLVISKVAFSPNILRTRSSFQLRVWIRNQQGNLVQGALVYELGLPYNWVRNSAELQTGADGSVTLTVTPTAKLPLGHPGALVMFVRARKPGDSLLSGVSTRRLIQVRIR